MIYFDNSATTRPSETCIKAMQSNMEDCFANASSLHSEGVKAKRCIDTAKKSIASKIGCTPNEVLLTSGGTYSNNLALHSAASALKRKGNRIVISSIEHPSITSFAYHLKESGFEILECNPLTDDFEKAIDRNTVLVSCMYVNNETGLILPIKRLKKIIAQSASPALLHIDAVQAFGKEPINVKELGCDFLSLSAHKINGPKGIGALFVRKGVRVVPLLHGGEQENELIPGTYNTPAITGFDAAVNELNIADKEHFKKLNNHFKTKIQDFDFINLNEFGEHADHIINISFKGYLGENVLHFLEANDIYVSQGSACSSHSKQKSKTLSALGKSKQVSDSSIRVSFDKNNTIEEIDTFFDICATIPDKLIKIY